MDENMEKQKKRRSLGCLFLVVAFMIIGISMVAIFGDTLDSTVSKINNYSANDEAETKGKQGGKTKEEIYRDFDQKSWDDFVEIYGVYQNYLVALNNYTKGERVNSYNAIKQYSDYFRDKYNALDYADEEEFKTYLQPLQAICLSSQTACNKTLKHIDTLEMKYLSAAQEEIENVKQNVSLFASNRGKLLVKAGYTDEEIKQKIELETSELQ